MRASVQKLPAWSMAGDALGNEMFNRCHAVFDVERSDLAKELSNKLLTEAYRACVIWHRNRVCMMHSLSNHALNFVIDDYAQPSSAKAATQALNAVELAL